MRSLSTIERLLILSLASVNCCQATLSSTKLKNVAKHNSKLVSNRGITVRGGAGPLDPVITAKLATTLVGIDTGLGIFFPSVSNKSINLPTSPILDFKLQYINYIAASHALSAACLLFGGSSVNTAVGAGLLFSNVPLCKAILTGKAKEFGFDVSRLYASAIIGAVTSCWLFANGKNANYLIKIIAVQNGISALGLMLVPLKAKAVWGLPYAGSTTTDGAIAFFNRFLGGILLAASVFYACLAYGVDAPKAVGYGVIPTFITFLVTNFVTKETKEFGVAMGRQFVSMAYIAALIYALVL